MKKIKRKTIIIILISIILLFFISIYLYYENNYLQVSDYTIESDKIPKDFDDFKIVQISDFHNTKSKKLTNDIIKEIKKQRPNIIVITGDLIDSKKYNLQVSLDFLKSIKDIAPIYYVSGNHESGSGKYDEITSSLKDIGIKILDDEFDIISINEDKIAILGLRDPSFYPSYISDQSKYDLKETINNIDDNNIFKLLISHRPEIFKIYVENNIDLVLTGHAHGGQIRIPFIGGLIAPNQGLFPKYTSGTFKEKNTTMIVSRGIGNSILPFRVNNRPELVVIKLKNK